MKKGDLCNVNSFKVPCACPVSWPSGVTRLWSRGSRTLAVLHDKTCQAYFCRLQLRVAQKVPGTVLSRQPASPRPTRYNGFPTPSRLSRQDKRTAPSRVISPPSVFLELIFQNALKKIGWSFVAVVLCLAACAKQGGPKRAEPLAQSAGIEERDPIKLYHQAKQANAMGSYQLALALLQRFVAVSPKHELYPNVLALRSEVEQRLGKGKIKIGVLLPMSGNAQAFGDSVWLGMSCALGLFDPCQGSSDRFQLIFKDSEGSPDQAKQAVIDLAEQEKVALIIGPLLSADAEAAAITASTLGVPLITLAPKEGLSKTSPTIFQHSLTAATEVSSLAQYSKTTGFKKIGIFYPKNRYGEEFETLFTEAIKTDGVEVTALGYDPATIDFTSFLRKIKMEHAPTKLYEGASQLFDAIFIPDAYRSASLLAQAWQVVDLGPVIFLGTSRWNHPNLLADNPQSLEGSIFVAGFYAESNRPVTQSFVSDFNRAFGSLPGWLEAAGFDAVRMGMEAIEIKNNDHWPDVQRGLLSLKNFSGAMGDLSWDDNRVSHWRLDLITVKAGALVPLEAPQ